MPTSDDVTELLERLAQGDSAVQQELFSQMYAELHRIAVLCLNGERREHTLQATELINEAYLRLIRQRQTPWQGRSHFFAIAATVMRRILTDYARWKKAGKRGAGEAPLQLDDQLLVSPAQCDLIADLDEALNRLATIDERAARVVEMKFFGGLTDGEVAEVLGLSSRTVNRDWIMARAWLYRELKGE